MTDEPKLVNEIIRHVQKETIDDPKMISDYIDKLSASIWDIGQARIKADFSYALKWRDIRKHVDSDKQADNEIMTTEEYKERETCKYAEKTVVSTMQGLKKRLSMLQEQYKGF